MVRSGIRSPVKAVGASTLETVQESSLPTTTAGGMGQSQGNKKLERERPSTIEENPMENVLSKSSKTPAESGSESGGARSARARSDTRDTISSSNAHSVSKPPSVNPKNSISQLNSMKAKIPSEGSAKNMTVETETVSSIPQVAVGGGAGDRNAPGRADPAGSLRLKPSSETIRPKKEKKKTVRKAPSINSGTGGSSRYFHHHHVCSRVASPEGTSPDYATSPDFRSFATNFLTSPGLAQPARSRSLAQAQVSKKRNSSVGLTSFRGRVASSKADIFEAKVASAVDEANSSDSDETFVYESNPPEPLSARPNRYHSRTPSATSMASQIDHHGARYRQDGHHSITGKKSMKFANNNNLSLHGNPMENGASNGRNSGGNNSHHHHIGRHGRGAAGHTSLFDNESPFPNAAKPLRTSASNGSHLSPRITTPRTPHLLRSAGLSSGKSNASLLYDLEGEGADDERTPLVGALRSGRTRNSRRPPNKLDNYDHPRTRGLCRKVTGWIVLGGTLGFLIAAVVIAVLLCSKPLIEVRIKEIENVLASEQELTLDLHVHAVNPNLVAIQVTELDIGIYAKSKSVPFIVAPREVITDHESSDSLTRGDEEMNEPEMGYSTVDPQGYGTLDGVDEGTDPIEDPDEDTQYQLLGRVLELDAPLIFDASPLRHKSISSIGEIRLDKPGNQTKGLSEWWEKVIQHPFELRVRGPLRYSLPVSSRVRSAIVSYTTTVQPEAPIDGGHLLKSPDEYSSIASPDSAPGRKSEVAGKRKVRFAA